MRGVRRYLGRFAWRALRRCRRGSAAMEFAIMGSVLMAMVFGFIATNALFYTWTAMQNSVENAGVMMATGQLTSFQSKAVSCSSTLTSSQVEYYACQGLPTWASFTATATENCTSPATVQVQLSVNGSSAALADAFSVYGTNTITAVATLMKQGTCP